ncbi:thiamine-phosphate pyrophosphorylase [Thermodesulfatator indicus DSM 15286]|uniref:Thiamine-phosphate synthase n=1 Tax=Thermodesulfatator indicus (strain DSM 15286 / JCM 11887 / CIR29812) TaxID=667014 RepID=F8AD02_THEID|nr:thiamine phosphate synthase [Thermodesulfatator indicus]AEH45868.1 thiamine-phosphate pyrophosphorylase [Thermodesulfatator indicus DSM 15286]
MSFKEKLRLYVLTDRKLAPEIESVKAALEGGATAIQLRLKNVSTREILEVAKKLRELTRDYGALFFVNDHLDVALAVNADGVQLGPDDLPVSLAKKIAPHLIVGASVYSLEEALKAEQEGADYLGAGAVFPTETKSEAQVLGLDGLKKIVASVKIPVVAIGGINHENVLEVLKTGVCGIALVSAIMGATDITMATKKMKDLLNEHSI